jgi:protein SCO1/2
VLLLPFSTSFKKMKILYPYILFAITITTVGCSGSNNSKSKTQNPKLPIYGERYYDEEKKDTVYHEIPDFELLNQDSVMVTQKDIEGKIFVADFFFTSCQTICPQMTSQLKHVAKAIEKMNDVYIISHTVDPETDTLPVLRAYAKDNGINTKKWWFLWGEESFIHEHGGQGYMLNVMRDSTAQGGFLHSSIFVLVDKKKHIRGLYDGTQTKDVEKLMKDIDKLRNEYEQNHTAAH